VLLNIFRYYVDTSPRFWPRLVHICRKWRRIIFSSHQALQLRLFCTHGTPVLKTLECWPALPIVVEYGPYGGSPALNPPAPADDDDDVMAALRHCRRVTSIDLSVTSSLRDRFSAIEEPFFELEDLVLQFQDGLWMTLPGAFQWGPRLHRLHLTRIAIPELPQLLASSRDLVDIQLHEMPDIGYSLLSSFRSALCEMTRLRSLSLQFLPGPVFANIDLSSLPGKYVLPTLTRLKYRGASKYLDNLVAGVDSPRLLVVEIQFFDEIYFRARNLGKLIHQMGKQSSQRQADILFSEHHVSITLTPPVPTCQCVTLQVFCMSSLRQLPSITQVCREFLVSLFDVEEFKLRISGTQPSRGQFISNREGWTALINAFRSTKRLHLAGDSEFSRGIALSLQHAAAQRETALPFLLKLRIEEPGPYYAPLREAVVSLMVSRRLSGSFTDVEYERLGIIEPGRICSTHAQRQNLRLTYFKQAHLLSM
jgi:hypothetical protein